ncbi:glycosyltransferase [Aurantiacibacter poecillastricola]|uniref:glycosyltransferase n=1 Tax=Aurantiacibacter poecillastricola TaxID=3064385 RepID=UPI00273E97FE|nr:glycosyltransferase [Aurantiacibacter sp. 219JJ12-13]MDP5261146.1 glycosyltransferase [Aurantiacibacter sp. 219JJ12-13]
MSAGPIGYFVHHQGRGHAERAAALANSIVGHRPITLFCARPEIFPELDERVDVMPIPSLFEPRGGEPPALADWRTPDVLHCAPLGWRSIRKAIATITGWFESADAALFVTDVSAELGQLARIASVPHVAVLQHGERDDPGHRASYESAVGILAPFSARLEQSERPGWMTEKTHYAPGLGIDISDMPSREEARRALGLPQDRRIVLVVAGGGGTGTPTAPITLGARDDHEALWITIGKIASEWHETPPGNLMHKGWVDNPAEWIAAADAVVSSCGNTTVHMVCAAGRPWVVVPEWRYFDEQTCKADALENAGIAAVARTWPSHAGSWRKLWDAASRLDLEAQKTLIERDASKAAARWLDGLATRVWSGAKHSSEKERVVT